MFVTLELRLRQVFALFDQKQSTKSLRHQGSRGQVLYICALLLDQLQILWGLSIGSLALMLEMSFGSRAAAESVRTAVAGAIREGWRTSDIAATGEKSVGTTAMAEEIARRVASRSGKG